MRGYLYILSHRAMPNLLKVGYTTRTVKERIQELSSTGVPGKFVVEFYCEVDNAFHLEKTVHTKLSKHRYDKEFFQCTLVIAVRAAKEALLSGGYCVFDSGGRSSKVYITDQEKEKIQHAKDERRRSDEIAARAKEDRDKKVKVLEQQFMQLAPVVEDAIARHCSLGKHGTLKGIAWLGLVVTAPFHLGLGLALADKFNPCSLDDGMSTAKKLSREEVANVREFSTVVSEIKASGALMQVAGKYYENSQSKGGLLICYENGSYDVSGIMIGVFRGLGLSPK